MLTASKPLSSPLQSCRELLRTVGGAGGVPGEMEDVADTQVCFGVILALNCVK